MNRIAACLTGGLTLLLLVLIVPTHAAIDVHEFDSTEQERRYRQLINDLGCPQCQNQSIGDSDADIAEDMRYRTAQMIREGFSDQDVITFFRDRYGDFVYYRPPLRTNTLLLWAGPILLLLLGLGLIARQVKRAALRPLDVEDDDSEEGQS